MQNQGLHELLLPHRLSLWGRTAEQINNLEHKDRPIESFPFPLPNPLDNMDINHVQIGVAPDGPPPQLKFHKLLRLQTTTLPTSRTRITKAVQRYPRNSRLHKVQSCNQLWDTLVRFAVGEDDGSDGDNSEHQEQQGQFHTYRRGAPPVPPLETQLKPAFNLWGWFLMHLTTPTPMVNSELSVQDEICRQLLHPIDQLIKTRYGAITTTSIIGEHQIENSFVPQWNRYVKGLKVNPISEAGIPDFLLLFKDGLKSVAMVAEAKNYWAYTAFHLRSALSTENLEDGRVTWTKRGVVNNIVKQLWSEMHEFKVKFGVGTNGQQIVVAINTTNETVPVRQRQNELTFSVIQDICGANDIYQGFAGFCFASIEYSVLATEDEKREFISNICPEEWRTAPVPLDEMPVFDEDDGRVERVAGEEESESESESESEESELESEGPESEERESESEEEGPESEEEGPESEDATEED